MNNGSNLLFKVTAVIRLLCVPVFLLLEKLWKDSISHTGFLSGMRIHIPFWQYLLFYTIMGIYAINTITGFVLSFMPAKIPAGVLQRKNLWYCLPVAELLILPVLTYGCYWQIRDTFFPPEPTIVGEVINFFWPPDPGDDISDKYEKLMVIDFTILTCCSLVFVIFFRKFYAGVQRVVHDDL